MNRIIFYIEKYKIVILFSVVIIALLLFYIIHFSKNDTEVSNDIVVNEVASEEITGTIKVDIKGMVENSGVYEVDSSARVIDVIDKAGGLINGANTDYLNLSKKLKDGDVIIVYSNDYIKSLKEEKIVYVELPCDCPDTINDACIKEELVNEEIDTPKDTTISINTATKEEFMTLPGVGESKAKAIIKYREDNNGFKELEDIMNVSGIGERAYAKIKEYIKL